MVEEAEISAEEAGIRVFDANGMHTAQVPGVWQEHSISPASPHDEALLLYSGLLQHMATTVDEEAQVWKVMYGTLQVLS